MTSSFISDAHVLVLGATGKTGRRVLQRLQARGVPARAGSRSGQTPFDWEQPATWPAALAGCTSVYVSFQPDLAVPGALETVTAFFAEARRANVQHIVLLSGRGEIEAEQAEQALAACGVAWTVLRASWFAQNFSEGFFQAPLQYGGALALPVGGVAEPFIDVDDIADVAVAALTEKGHEGRLYELTGPQTLTFSEAVAQIGRAAGREMQFAAITPEQFRVDMAQVGTPADAIDLALYLFATVLDGRNSTVADGVQQALGRPAKSFAAFAHAAAAAGAWQAAQG
jgi:uncharacterized protein YbjT (DUF2867 family)